MRTMDEALRQYQADIARAQISRRRFMTGAALATTGALLAACTPAAQATPQPTAGPSAPPSTGPSSAPGTASPSASAAPSYAVESDFTLYNWSTYFSPDNKKAFSDTFGIKNFTESFYPSNEEMLAKLKAGGKGQDDVAAPTADVTKTLADGGFLEKLDKSRLPNLASVNKRFLTLPFDPNDDYIVPKDWGTTVIIYRGNKVTEPVTSWKDFFDLGKGKYSGKVFVVDSPGDVFVAPLALHGF